MSLHFTLKKKQKSIFHYLINLQNLPLCLHLLMLAQVLSIKYQLPRTEVINESLIPQSNLNANNNLLHVIQYKIWLISKQIKTKI